MKDLLGLAVMATILVSPLVIFAVTADPSQLVRFFPDDAFYYLQPAHNFVRTGTPSFDGLHATNGFHPLYFLIVSTLAVFASKSALVVASQIANAVFIFLAAGLVVAGFRLRPGWVALAVFAILTMPPLIGLIVLCAGLEASTVWVCTVLLLFAFQRALDARLQSTARNLWLGITMTLLMFARLDHILVLAPFVLLTVIDSMSEPTIARPWPRLRALLTVLCIPALLGSAYLAWNYLWTGHCMPIHGYVKQASYFPWDAPWRAATGGGWKGLVIGGLPAAASVATLAAIAAGAPAGRSRIRSLVALNLGNLVFYLYLLFLASNFFRWYFAYPLACLMIDVVFVVSLSSDALAKLQRFRHAIVAALVVVNLSANTAFLVWVGNRENSTSYQLMKVAQRVDRHGGPDAVTGTFDAGVVGYHATGTVINLDGLANNFDFYENYWRPGRFEEYFQGTGMTHFLVRDGLIDNADEVRQGVYRCARFARDPRIVLRRENELFRYTLPGNFTVYYFKLETPPKDPRANAPGQRD